MRGLENGPFSVSTPPMGRHLKFTVGTVDGYGRQVMFTVLGGTLNGPERTGDNSLPYRRISSFATTSYVRNAPLETGGRLYSRRPIVHRHRRRERFIGVAYPRVDDCPADPYPVT